MNVTLNGEPRKLGESASVSDAVAALVAGEPPPEATEPFSPARFAPAGATA